MLKNLSKLTSGDTIGVLAVSAACESSRFEKGLNSLQNFGFKTRVALDPVAAYGSKQHMFSSDSPSNRAAALAQLYADPEVKAIIAARGAYGSMELLPLIDFEKLSKNPKPLIGFSDVTALLIALYQNSNLAVIHGPTLESSFFKSESEVEHRNSAEALLACLQGQTVKELHAPLSQLCGSEDSASGPLVGGNLSIISSMLATPWEPKFDGHILFLEEVAERPFRVHRMLLQLKLAGKLENLKGVLLGSFSKCEHPKGLGPNLEQVIQDIFSNVQYPVLGFAQFGHVAPNFPLVLGLETKISQAGIELPEFE